jgi:putative ABC transport system substrate-binding protein
MRRREFIGIVGGAAAWPIAAFAQVSARHPLVAILIAGSLTTVSRFAVDGFSEGMQQLGYIEGRDIDIVYRYADDDMARLPALANELVRLMPRVFVTATLAGTLAIKQATAAIPIVNPALTDPVGFGLVASQARPGGQVTGIMITDPLFLCSTRLCGRPPRSPTTVADLREEVYQSENKKGTYF